MKKSKNNTSNRKQDHIKICLEDDVQFKSKTTGFENYDFEHYAITELTLDEIDLSSEFFGKKISYPFLISCMTGGTLEAESIMGTAEPERPVAFSARAEMTGSVFRVACRVMESVSANCQVRQDRQTCSVFSSRPRIA